MINQLKTLASNWDKKVEPHILDLRADMLMDIPEEKLSKVFLRSMMGCRYMPSVAELREMAQEIPTETPQAPLGGAAKCPDCDDTGFVDTAPVNGNRTLRRCHCHGDRTSFERRKQQNSPPLDAGKDYYSAGDVWAKWVEICAAKGKDATKRMPSKREATGAKDGKQEAGNDAA